jgi:hypothetical protein
MQIQPLFLTVGALLNGRLFRIPQYQRAYSWGTKQRRDLFDDIEKVFDEGEDASHFMATVVALRRKKRRIAADEFVELEVVDGQQRLTTLLILMRATSKALDPKAKQHSKLADEIQSLLVNGDDLSLLLLQTNHDSSHIFANYLREGLVASKDVATTTADSQSQRQDSVKGQLRERIRGARHRALIYCRGQVLDLAPPPYGPLPPVRLLAA